MIAPTVCPHCGIAFPTPRGPARRLPGDEAVPDPEPSAPGPALNRQGEPDATPPSPTAADIPFNTSEVEAVSFPIEAVPGEGDAQGPDPRLLGLVLEGGPSGLSQVHPTARSAAADRAVSAGLADADDCDEAEDRRSAWPLALLASYASAMTLACGWLWWTGHRPRPFGEGPALATVPARLAATEVVPDEPADPGLRAGSSAAVPALEPIAEGRRVPIGERLRVDALEVTPLGIQRGPVELVRTRVDGQPERRDGGRGALGLRLLLRNTSDDLIFAPLDEAFVREPDRRLPETFIQDASGTRVYAYRLPATSEWNIAGQDFRELRPGESFETIVVSDTEAIDRLIGPLTWRLRLRTAPETTAVVGVSFRAAEVDRVVPSPARPDRKRPAPASAPIPSP